MLNKQAFDDSCKAYIVSEIFKPGAGKDYPGEVLSSGSIKDIEKCVANAISGLIARYDGEGYSGKKVTAALENIINDSFYGYGQRVKSSLDIHQIRSQIWQR